MRPPPSCCTFNNKKIPEVIIVVTSYWSANETLLVVLKETKNNHHETPTKLYNRKVGVSWWLFLVSLRTTSNVSLALQYDVTTIITSGIFLLLNVHYVRYRRELFINKSVLF